MISVGDLIKLVKQGLAIRRWWTERRNPVATLPGRVLQVFDAHGVQRTQIPRVLGKESGLRIEDLLSEKTLLPKLDTVLLNKIADMFGVRLEWLENGESPIYPYLGFYKNLPEFAAWARELRKKWPDVGYFVLKPKDLDPLDKSADGDVVVVFRACIANLGDKSIYRYFPFTEDYPWNHTPARLHLKGMCLICWGLNIYPFCRSTSTEVIQRMLGGAEFPELLLAKTFGRQWHLDDYILTSQESVAAKDEPEAREVRKLIERQCIETPAPRRLA